MSKPNYRCWVRRSLGLGLVTAAATAGWLWHVQGARVQALEYKTAAAHHGDLTQTVTANGQINPVMNVFPRHLRS